MKVLVTGATGYIGGRLVPALLAAGYEVRCLARDPDKLSHDPWRESVEVVAGDVLRPDTLGPALEGCDFAFYLVHSMGGGPEFWERDRQAAADFSDAAGAAGVKRIVYLGGLGRGDDLSRHLASRQEVGRILASGATPVTEIRAAVIIGSGSVSFEMIRYLTEVLPVMVTPKWVRTVCQPIAIRNVLEILTKALDTHDDKDHMWEIGGPDRVTYQQMMQIYAEVAGLRKRLIIPVPLLSPQLSKHWIGLVTPLPTGVAKPLVDSLRNEVVVEDNSVAEELAGELIPYREAVALALRRSQDLEVTTRWSDAATKPAEARPSDPDWAGGTTRIHVEHMPASAAPDDVFWAFSRIGGEVGYYTFDWAWKLRGFVDSLLGGVGIRRGRRHAEELRPGEALDFWRVAVVEPGRRLQLHAEMKLPGKAWLEFECRPVGLGAELWQRAYFQPRGLFGRAYWAALFPVHLFLFRRMARHVVEVAAARARHEIA